MNRIKIAHILNSVGGVDVSLRLILENIDSGRFENIVIHGKHDTDKPYLDNIKRPIKDYKLSIQREINIFNDLRVVLKTIKILKKDTPQLIHAHSAKGGIIGKIVGGVLNIPVLHTPQAYSYLSAETNFKRNLYLFFEKCFRGTNNKILASSVSEQNRAIEEVGYKKENTLLFNNSIRPIVEIKPLTIDKTWPDRYICSVGRPSFQKNIELMLDVLARIKETDPKVHLVLMGVGYHSPNLQNVKEKIKTLSLEDNITLLEWTLRDDIFGIIKNSQLYLTTARYEGLPYSVIESLALGKAIVATDADGNRDLVQHQHNGFLIDHQDVKGLADAVITLLRDNKTKQEFSKNALNVFFKKFDMTKNITKLESIYINSVSSHIQ